MNRRNILAIVRQLAEAGPPASDAELLRRFVATRDEAAFAMLVQRHGRLVWAVCHNLAGPDAEDAFQATFLVLLRNAGKIRKATSLPAWLHGVAYRVSSKARQTAKRRSQRERSVAKLERGGSVVADSTWDRAMAAVHEEIVNLPESLRVPFVLCSLEGKSVTDAAAQLGWKLGTLSGRLTRAKDALLARLQARGVTLGAAAALACASETAPAQAIANAAELAQSNFTVPVSILKLSQGVIGMSAYHAKLLAAGVMLACSLAIGGGAGWVATAQTPTAPPPKMVPPPVMSPEERVKELERQLESAKKELALQREFEELQRKIAVLANEEARAKAERFLFSTANWTYDFIPVREIDAAQFVKLLQGWETNGWEFSGQITLKPLGSKGGAVWVFKKPAKKPMGQKERETLESDKQKLQKLFELHRQVLEQKKNPTPSQPTPDGGNQPADPAASDKPPTPPRP